MLKNLKAVLFRIRKTELTRKSLEDRMQYRELVKKGVGRVKRAKKGQRSDSEINKNRKPLPSLRLEGQLEKVVLQSPGARASYWELAGAPQWKPGL